MERQDKHDSDQHSPTRCLHPHADQVGGVRILGFEREILNGSRRVETALAMILGDLTEGAPLIRIHSQCFTGEVLGSLAAPTPHSLAYLRAKKERMGHALGLGRQEHTRYPDHAPDRFEFATIETAVRELKAGRMIVVVDDEDRENEGDLTMAAELVTPEAINFMATHGRGLVCLAMPGERLDELDLAPMAPENTALHGTAFTISIDAKEGVTTGISAHDRAHTIKAAVDPASLAEDFARPGHVFPLRARPGGVLDAPWPDRGSRRSCRSHGVISRWRHLRDR